ncbi:hypothetical protein IFM89_015193 [Coptis chinensis]|uniref:Helicase ATP-binding domain-containing protein n=1 Tax=Coptis chinensis TaxID=261450 RepID=A0A835LIP2_9MAGN|nr:hypothetical protein IFM89_015193 [Coptis chinensis]
MGKVKDNNNDAYEEELLDYEEDEDKALDSVSAKAIGKSAEKGHVGIHSSGMDVICQAKSGMGKTAVFVLSMLRQIEPSAGQVAALVLCHKSELAYHICHEFERFSTYLPDLKVTIFYGGVHIKNHKDLLKNECPHVVVGTPGILALAREKDLPLKNVRHFILDECDKMLESLDMQKDVQENFKMTPHDKQVMMFSTTLSKEIRPICFNVGARIQKLLPGLPFPMEIYVDDEAKLTLHELVQLGVVLASGVILRSPSSAAMNLFGVCSSLSPVVPPPVLFFCYRRCPAFGMAVTNKGHEKPIRSYRARYLFYGSS